MSRSASKENPAVAPANEHPRRHAPPRRSPAAALARPDIRLPLLIESAVEYAIFTLHADGRIADWNDGGEHLFGYDAADIVDRPVDVLFALEEQGENLPEHLLDEALRCRRSAGTGWCRRQDGARFPARVEFRLVGEPSGPWHGFGCIVRDVSEQRELEQLRADASREAVAREDTQSAEQASSEFLSMISHEIRTPLTGVKGFTDALALQELSPLQRRYVELANASCTALMTIVDDLLDFTRMDAGEIDLREEPFAVAALAHTALSMVLGVARPKSLSLSVTIAPGVPACLLGDQGRLRQILLNLLANAVKFTLRGSVSLQITTQATANDREIVKFAVVDTGIGIPEDRLPRLFNRFTQADASIRDRFGGTGLGLAICKQLVERMGGEMGVTTALGYGSTFWFTVSLPQVRPAPPAAADRPLGAAPSKNIRVLLVDDGRMNQEIARIFLQHAGYGVHIVDNGADAISLVQTEPFDAVLMDMQMPEMDGLEATRRIRSLGGEFARLPIIALSARVFSDDVAQCLAAGMNDHLGKPFDREEMSRVIDRWTAKPN